MIIKIIKEGGKEAMVKKRIKKIRGIVAGIGNDVVWNSDSVGYRGD